MSIWARVGLAILIGAAVGVIAALVGSYFGVGGGPMGGAAGEISAGVIAATLRPKN